MRLPIVCLSVGLLVFFDSLPSSRAEEISTPSARGVASDPPFYLIRPGTPIQDGPPPSWSHFVVKAQTRLASGDVDTLPGWGARMAARIRTVILADIGHAPDDPERFVLRKVGIGLCMPDRTGCDIVVNSNRAGDLGFELGTLEKVVLESAEAELTKGRMIVSTPTFGIYRSPTTMLSDGEHRAVEIYYGFLVNPESGSLRVAVWSREASAVGRTPTKRLVELKPNLVCECQINVQASRLLGTIPISWSFAMQELLPGRSLAVSPELAGRLEAIAEGKLEPRLLEESLIECLTRRSTIRGSASTDSLRVLDGADVSDLGRPGRTSTVKSAPLGTNPSAR